MPTPDDPLTTARAYHRAWTSGDFSRARGLLAPSLETDVPINSYTGPEDWIAAVERTQGMTETVELLSELHNDDEALLLYDIRFPAPVGPLRVAEHFTVRGGRIERIRHVHDTYRLRTMMATESAQ